MSIAILGWGSLIWDARDLKSLIGPWQTPGPTLPIEFSRISRDLRLTLVIDQENGAQVQTQYAVSCRVNIDEAISDLAQREATSIHNIGFVNRPAGAERSRTRGLTGTIASWAAQRGIDSVIWTDLPSNFVDIKAFPFNAAAAAAHIRNLSGETRDRAVRYIQSAPGNVDTPVRRFLKSEQLI